MDLPVALRHKIVDFLASLPNIHNNETQQAFVFQAGLDDQLQNHLPFGKTTAQFVPRLVALTIKYGRLQDGRNALEAILESAKDHVGLDKRKQCDCILKELHEFYQNYERIRKNRVSKQVKQSVKIAPNPFGDRGCITDPKRFFDREEILRQILEALRKGSSIALIGEFRIGKSSILAMIRRVGPKALKLPSEVFLFLDMQPIRDEDEFFEALCDDIGIPTCRGFKLTRALRGKRYILCLDEIEKMNKKERFSRDVREELRGLAGSPDAPLSLVIASRTPLERLFPDSPDLTSPLANICVKLDAKPFSPKLARNFLLHRLKHSGMAFTENQISDLINRTGGHPGKLQDEAAQLYSELRRNS